MLIQQEWFELAAMCGKALPELSGRELPGQRFRSQTIEHGVTIRKIETAELTCIMIAKLTPPVDIKDNMVVFAIGRIQSGQVKTTGHAQVGQHFQVVVQLPDNELGPSRDGFDATPCQFLSKTFWSEPRDAARPADMNVRDGLTDEAGGQQIVDNGLDFRQFRQSVRLGSCFAKASSGGLDDLVNGCAMVFLPMAI